MSLADRSALDFAAIIGDPKGFSRSVTITSPKAAVAVVLALTNHIEQKLDPETNTLIVGESASVVFSAAALEAAGMSALKVETDENERPWLVSFADARGVVRTWRVMTHEQDYGQGEVRCQLDPYRK